ncbi:MAG: sulfur carrier protein ThiS [Spiribacter sp.]|nr:sulfur carrier protein ThiS [Spiribacter sp.]MDR9488734.1 sulfur carrier protein ThiS [Spiribacter sp.]
MTIQVNGNPQTLPEGSSIETLLEQLKLSGQRIAVEHNEDVIPRSEYAQTALQAGDRVEIIRAIGGG